MRSQRLSILGQDEAVERTHIPAHRLACRRKAHRRGWMIGNKVPAPAVHANLTMDLRQPKSPAKDLSNRLRPEEHDELRIDQIDLTIEPAPLARIQLIDPGGAVAGGPTLDVTGDQYAIARHPRAAQHVVKKASRPPDKRPTLYVLSRARGLADDKYGCWSRPFSRHGSGSAFTQPTFGAPLNAGMKRIELSA